MAKSTKPRGEAAELSRGLGRLAVLGVVLIAAGYGGRRIVGMVPDRPADEETARTPEEGPHGGDHRAAEPVQPE